MKIRGSCQRCESEVRGQAFVSRDARGYLSGGKRRSPESPRPPRLPRRGGRERSSRRCTVNVDSRAKPHSLRRRQCGRESF